jgi:hypothetical protein
MPDDLREEPGMTRQHSSRPALLISQLIMLGLTSSYFFTVGCFFANGLHHYAYDDIWWQRTPNAGDFPISELASLGGLGAAVLFTAMMVASLGGALLPAAAWWLTARVRSQWPGLRWYERSLWLVITAATLIATVIMWSPLGRAILTWITD